MQPHGKVAFQVFGLKLRCATPSILRIHHFDKTVCTAYTMVRITEKLSASIKIEIKGLLLFVSRMSLSSVMTVVEFHSEAGEIQ